MTTGNESDRQPNDPLALATVDQQIRLHALQMAVVSRQANPPVKLASRDNFADQVVLDAAKYESFLRGATA